MYSLGGVWWAQLLLDTGRVGVTRRLTEANHKISSRNDWNEDVARCQRLLARCYLADGAPAVAAPRLHAALATFREGGDYVLELAETLVVFAEQQRGSGLLSGALGGADADVIAGDLLLDFKAATTKRIVRGPALWQVVGYALADTGDICGVRAVGISALRWRRRWIIDLDELVARLAGERVAVGVLRREFADLFA